MFRKGTGPGDRVGRKVQMPEGVAAEVQGVLRTLSPRNAGGRLLKLDPAHVRRKFYERAEAIGMPRELGAPEVIRRSRAVELMQGNVPLPVVQMILGHSTPNLAASYVKFSEDDMHRAETFFIDRENRRKTSARNAFFGKIETLRKGDVQAWVEISTPGGYRICAVITNHSLKRLGLKPGALVAAEVKAPWVTIHLSADDPECSADNVLGGTVERIVARESDLGDRGPHRRRHRDLLHRYRAKPQKTRPSACGPSVGGVQRLHRGPACRLICRMPQPPLRHG